jgi:hypothetical protein
MDSPYALTLIDGTRAGRFVYSVELGEAIALAYGNNEPGGLWGIHQAAPDEVPPPHIVNAWKRQFPAFGLRMKEAERLRAECMMEQTLVIADTDPAAAPRVALKIQARQHYAARLDSQRFGTSPGAASQGAGLLGHDPQPVAIDATDEQLAAIALAGVAGEKV